MAAPSPLPLLLLLLVLAPGSPFSFPFCPLPRAPHGGHVSLGRGGAVVNFSCRSGYQLEGRAVAVCVGGKWSSPSPVCSLLTSAEATESVPERGSPKDIIGRLEEPRLMDQQIITVYRPPDSAILQRLADPEPVTHKKKDRNLGVGSSGRRVTESDEDSDLSNSGVERTSIELSNSGVERTSIELLNSGVERTSSRVSTGGRNSEGRVANRVHENDVVHGGMESGGGSGGGEEGEGRGKRKGRRRKRKKKRRRGEKGRRRKNRRGRNKGDVSMIEGNSTASSPAPTTRRRGGRERLIRNRVGGEEHNTGRSILTTTTTTTEALPPSTTEFSPMTTAMTSTTMGRPRKGRRRRLYRTKMENLLRNKENSATEVDDSDDILSNDVIESADNNLEKIETKKEKRGEGRRGNDKRKSRRRDREDGRSLDGSRRRGRKKSGSSRKETTSTTESSVRLDRTENLRSEAPTTTSMTTLTTPIAPAVQIPEYTVAGQRHPTDEVVNIVTDDSVTGHSTSLSHSSRGSKARDSLLRSYQVEAAREDDVSIAQSQEEEEVDDGDGENASDPLVLLYRTIANRRKQNRTEDSQQQPAVSRKRKGRRNRQRNNNSSKGNVLDDSESDSDTDDRDKIQRREKPTVNQETSIESPTSPDLYPENYDEERGINQDEYDAGQRGIDVSSNHKPNPNNPRNELADSESNDRDLDGGDNSETTVERIGGVSQELPEGYPTDRLNLENHEGGSNARFRETEDINFSQLDTSCIISAKDELYMPPPRVKNARVSAYFTVTNPAEPHNSYVEVIYECNFNHELREGTTNRLFCRSDTWLGTLPICEHYKSSRRECGDNNGGCEQICERSDDGDYQCFCYKGFRLQEDRFSCKDVDECLENNGGCDDVCFNEVGTHACYCSSGFRLATNGRSCIDKNECLLRNGHGPCQDRCTNTDGSYLCSCDSFPGTRLGEDGHTCADVDECEHNNGGCAHVCLNTFGQIFCTCHHGYQLAMDWKSCNDLDECSHPSIAAECPHGCINTPGSYRCGSLGDTAPVLTCSEGTRLDEAEEKCLDIDECAKEDNRCSHSCSNTHGSFSCGCPTGYQLGPDQRTCRDLDECSEGRHHCSHDCQNDEGSYTCTCRRGYELANDGNTCLDVDECSSGRQRCSHNCSNTQGSYSCSCPSGYLLGEDLRTCDDVDECSASPPCSHGCWNKPGSFRCTCPRRLVLAPNGTTCIDNNECAEGNGGCSQVCLNTLGSFSCSCLPGYVLADDGTTCDDVDECEDDNGSCSQECTNTPGSFKCSCADGFDLIDDQDCADINECDLHTHGCQHICHNLPGSFRCDCFEGFVLDPISAKMCSDFDECSADVSCSHFCSNENGTYVCHCPPGFDLSKDRHTCVDVDECLTDRAGCSQLCVNTGGGYSCSCKEGFQLIAEGTAFEKKHDCVDIDDCDTDNGGCSHSCINSEGGFKCECPTGFEFMKTGDGDSLTQCVDINECEDNNGGCSSSCLNLIGSFECSCPKGMQVSVESNSVSGTNECVDIDECANNNGRCSQICINLVGSHECGCSAGFELDIPSDYYDDYAEEPKSAEVTSGSWWNTCLDVDECADNNGDCSHECVNEEGSYKCVCPSGYQLASNGVTCVDNDECETGNGGCSDSCNNSPGSYHCSCKSGYTLNGVRCLDIDECSVDNGSCSHSCVNEAGSYKCVCPDGLLLEYDNKTCSDINECGKNNGGCSHDCRNQHGMYRCSCPSGFKLSYDNHTCSDIDECDLNEKSCSHVCSNTVGSFKCDCPEGLSLAVDGKTCVDINECGLNNGGCSHQCSNRERHYQCLCPAGYRLSNDQHNCVDINECLVDNGSCDYKCINQMGGFECLCQLGFKLRADNSSCQDVDECAEGSVECEGECHNTRGSFRCGCPVGYQLATDGISCEDVNECSVAQGGCSHECANTPGSFHCRCQSGYSLSADGLVCLDEDECLSAPCHHICLNSLGSYECLCSPGYQPLPHAPNECSDVDECSEGTDGCGQQCLNTLGSYSCACKSGFLLGSDGHSCEAEAVFCPLLVAPMHGSQRCSHEAVGQSYPEGTRCNFYCVGGTALHGPNTTVCTPHGNWDMEPPTCVAAKCSILTSVEHGRLAPSRCSRRPSNAGEHCYLSCSPGYGVVGNPVQTCLENGLWSPAGTSPFCEKASVKPFIQCPSDVSVPLPAHQRSAYVRLPQPKANVDWYRFVDASPEWAKELESDLPAGTTTVTFVARSPSSDESATCSFSVEVVDSEEPRVADCPTSFTVELPEGESSAVATWNEPLFTDNVEITNIWKSMEPGRRLTAGTYPVHYVASDSYKNRAKCSFTVSVQAFGPSAQVPYESSRVMAVCPGLNGGQPIKMFAWRVPPACSVVWRPPTAGPALWDTTRTHSPATAADRAALEGRQQNTEPTAAPTASDGRQLSSPPLRGDLGSSAQLEETHNESPVNVNGEYNDAFRTTTTTLTSHPNSPHQYQSLQYHLHNRTPPLTPSFPHSYYTGDHSHNYLSREGSQSRNHYGVNRPNTNYHQNNNYLHNYYGEGRHSKEETDSGSRYSSAVGGPEQQATNTGSKENAIPSYSSDTQPSSHQSRSSGSNYNPSSGLSATALLQQLFQNYQGGGGGSGGVSSALALAHAQASGGRGGGTALAHVQGNDMTQALAHARVYSSG